MNQFVSHSLDIWSTEFRSHPHNLFI